MGEVIFVRKTGLTPYCDAWRLQHVAHSRCRLTGENILLLTEHYPTITIGYRRPLHQLLLSPTELLEKGIVVVPVERGGGATYHGPGQLVAYPIFSSLFRRFGVRRFISLLEDVMRRVCEQYGVMASFQPGRPGLWVENRKIGAVGIAVRQGTSLHGLALNVNIDKTPFSYIVPCGLAESNVTSLTDEVGQELRIEEIREQIIQAFYSVFAVPIEEMNDACGIEREALTSPMAHP